MKKKSAAGKKSAGPKTTMKVGKKTYTKVSCHTSKREATKRAKKIRESGGTARVLKSGKANCVYKGPRRKK